MMNIDDLEDLDDETRKQVEELQKVSREKDGGDAFAEAQLDVFSTVYGSNQRYLGFKALNSIIEDDNKLSYDIAQLTLAVHQYYSYDGDIDKAANKLMSISSKTPLITLGKDKSLFMLAKDYISRNRYSEASKILEAIIDTYPYEAYCYLKICKILISEENKIIGEYLLEFLKETLTIMSVLTLDFGGPLIEEKLPERKLAHYTSPDVADLLLNTNNKEKLLSAFRLNTINNVNDPSEGQLLPGYLDYSVVDSVYSPDFDENLHAFISCFTFNHDSLNQFRLYGKQNNKEASGVSLVFNKDFFQSSRAFNGITFLPFRDSVEISIKKESSNENEQDKTIEAGKRIDKQSVMRCIYLDPDSRYIQLAQRDRLTFYRECEPDENPEEKWQEYKKDIDQKTIEVKRALQILVNTYQEVKYEYPEDFKSYSDFIDEVLLPLKYLVKHSAFQEEQECRMIYITSLDKPEVQMDYGKFLYVEYDADVKASLDKIYIAPAATQYQPYLAKLLCDSKVKIEPSKNPYRQT